ncbi:hypothetical protein PU629_02325 [Pullulanibacillus sp. KACC 23026]|nr:hypothetical protein [Pullulanibacillus sp. KACC 23026]WEG13222.1 hypothetical protein PU629_02325 [Pullulanibacillus sp. KACC 23026]
MKVKEFMITDVHTVSEPAMVRDSHPYPIQTPFKKTPSSRRR